MKPSGYLPPPSPTLYDIARTVRVALTDLSVHLARLATHRFVARPSTSTPEGLSQIAEAFNATLGHVGVDLEVLHASRVPKDGGLVLMWNQESHLDHLVLAAAIPRAFFSLYNNEVARVPFYGSHMRATGHVHVDRSDESQWRGSIARAAARVRDGECVLVSPEGTRSWDGALLPMKRGAFILAASSERPIVCVTVIGGHARMPRGSPIVRAGPMRVVFSEPILPAPDRPPDRLPNRLEAGSEAVAATFVRMKKEYAL